MTQHIQAPSPLRQKPFGGISSSTLRWIALFLMVLDHMWGTVISGNDWMTYLGRLCYPIFAFQLVEGFFHTSDLKKYKRRLFLFALISEIPFDLAMNSTPIFPFQQNVMFTLLLGLWVCSAMERARERRTIGAILLAVLAVLAARLLGMIAMLDYGALGIDLIVMFYLMRGFPFAWAGQLAGMILLNIVWFKGQSLVLHLGDWEYFFPTQGFAVLALLPIWLYNGKKGMTGKAAQYVSYWFYPAHLLVLWLAALLFL